MLFFRKDKEMEKKMGDKTYRLDALKGQRGCKLFGLQDIIFRSVQMAADS